jgi:predicted nucleic acid-binding protein
VEIVSNSGPLISLGRMERLDLPSELFREVIVPAAVFQELTRDLDRPGAAVIQKVEWLSIREVSNTAEVARLSFWLDLGESEVLVLARELEATAAIDERRGRNIATALGIPHTGTVGILLSAKQAGIISTVTPLLDKLIKNGIRLSARLYEEARRLAGE